MKKLVVLVALAAGLAAAGAASANTNLGGATTNADGSVTLSSVAAPSAGIDVSLPGVTFVGDISAFSLTYSFPNGCPTGVPTLAIVTVRGTIWVSLGGVSGFSCTAGPSTAYVLNTTTPADTHEIVGGTVSDSWGRAHSEYDNLRVNAVQLLTTGPGQTMTVSNVSLVITPGAPTATM